MHVQDSENFCSVFEGHLISITIPHKKEEGSYAYLYRCKIPPTHFKGIGIRTLPLPPGSTCVYVEGKALWWEHSHHND